MSLIPVNITINGDTATEALVQVTYELGTLNSICYITYFNAGGKQIGYTHQSVVDLFDLPTQSALATLLLSQVNIQNLTRIILYSYELYSTYIVLKYYTDTPSFYKVFIGTTIPTSVSDSISGVLFGVATPQARINGTSSILTQIMAKGFSRMFVNGTSNPLIRLIVQGTGSMSEFIFGVGNVVISTSANGILKEFINGTSAVVYNPSGQGILHELINGTSGGTVITTGKGIIQEIVNSTAAPTIIIKGLGNISDFTNGTTQHFINLSSRGILSEVNNGTASVTGNGTAKGIAQSIFSGTANVFSVLSTPTTNTGNYEVTSDGTLVNLNVIPEMLAGGAAMNEVLKSANKAASKGLSYAFYNNQQNFLNN